MLGAIMGALGSSFLEDSSKKGQTEFNKEQQLDLMRKTPAAQMQGFKDAGLNPMLAYQQGSFPSLTAGSGITSPGAVYSQMQGSAAAVSQAETASRQTDSNVDKITQEISNLKTDQERTKAFMDNIREEYQNLVKQGYNLTEIGNNLRATINEIRARTDQATFAAIESDLRSQLFQLDIRAAKSMDNLGREAQQLKPLFDILRSILGRRH